MRGFIDAIWKLIDEVVPTILFLVVTVMVATDIFLRNTLGITIPGGIEISTYAFVWFIFLAAAGAARTGGHFQVSMMQDALGERGQQVSTVLIELVGLVVVAIMTKVAWEYTARSWNRVSDGLELPLGYFYIIFPFSFALMTLAHARRIWGCIMTGGVRS